MHSVMAAFDRIAAPLSVKQTAAVGGASSLTAIAAVFAVDSGWTVWLRLATLGVGLLSGLAGLLLVAMKIVQQRREMRSWAKRMRL